MPDDYDGAGEYGQWREQICPVAPTSFAIRTDETEIPSRTGVWLAGISLRPYDFRDYRSSDQIDTFQIRLKTGTQLPDGLPATGVVITWKITLSDNATKWELWRKTKSSPLTYRKIVDNMATAGISYTDICIPPEYPDSNNVALKSLLQYLVIKTGAKNSPAVGVRDYVNLNPWKFALEQNYPNPFNPTTEFKFTVAKKGRATLQVYNTLGQEVMKLFDGTAEPNRSYQVTLDGSRLASGVYFYRLTSVEEVAIKKMVLLK
jgi:hypothetical protein